MYYAISGTEKRRDSHFAGSIIRDSAIGVIGTVGRGALVLVVVKGAARVLVATMAVYQDVAAEGVFVIWRRAPVSGRWST